MNFRLNKKMLQFEFEFVLCADSLQLAENGVMTSDAPVLGCGQTKSVSRLSFVWSSRPLHSCTYFSSDIWRGDSRNQI